LGFHPYRFKGCGLAVQIVIEPAVKGPFPEKQMKIGSTEIEIGQNGPLSLAGQIDTEIGGKKAFPDPAFGTADGNDFSRSVLGFVNMSGGCHNTCTWFIEYHPMVAGEFDLLWVLLFQGLSVNDLKT